MWHMHLHFYKREKKLRKKNQFVEYHKFTVIEPLEEIYPETKQKLVRPKVNIPCAILKVVLVLISIALISLGCSKLIEHFSVDIPFSIGVQFVLLYILGLILSLIVFAKRIVVFFIRVYQRYGPYEVRCRCLFVPNCSEYMILAIKKYGLIKGLKKGINRYKRCHAPNGGVDYP